MPRRKLILPRFQFRPLLLSCAAFLFAVSALAQEMSMDEAVRTARSQSVAALEARHAFVSTYWSYRSYKASHLPSLHLYGNLMNFNRSLTQLQSYEDGTYKYVTNNNLQNSFGIRMSQNVIPTGGTLSIYSDLSRTDQFGDLKRHNWYSQPITMSYVQPLFAYNSFKWDNKIEPKEYERGKSQYLESMEQVTLNTVKAYYDLLLARMENQISRDNFENTGKMYSIAKERLSLGSVTRDECLQLELQMLNDSISLNESDVKLRESQMSINSILGFDESFEISPILNDELPDLAMDYDLVLDMSLENSSFQKKNQVDLLNAQASVARAKADRGVTMAINASFGLSQTNSKLNKVYSSPLDQEVVGLSFSVPIFDWGLGKGKIQKAKAAEDVVRAQIQQAENDYRRKVFMSVGQFNNQKQQCNASRRARQIAAERYELMIEKFKNGNASVTDLINAQDGSNSADRKYITDISNYWTYYYTLRQFALYDFISGHKLEIDVKEMVEK